MQQDAKTLRTKRIISICSLVIMLALFIAIAVFVGKPLVEMFKKEESFKEWIKQKGFLGQLAMIGIMLLQVFVAIIPGEPIEIGAGYAFGAAQGMLLCLIGSAIGLAIIYPLTRIYGMKMVELFVPREKLENIPLLKKKEKLDALVFILYFIPGTPKDIFNYVLGLTPMSLGRALLITTIARIPSVLSSTLFGSLTGDSKYTIAIIVYGITAVLSVVGALIYKKMTKPADQKDVPQA